MTTFDRARKRQELIATRTAQVAQLKQLRKDIKAERLKIAELSKGLTTGTPRGQKSLRTLCKEFEAALITDALETSKGSVVKAAALLGESYQALIYIINERHPALIAKRSPIRRRASGAAGASQ